MNNPLTYSNKPRFNSIDIEARDNDGNLILVAKWDRYLRLSMIDRKKFKHCMKRLESGDILAAKVPEFQVLLFPKHRKKFSLSNSDILEILNDIAFHFEKIMGDYFLMEAQQCRDISDEDFESELKKGNVARDYRFIIPIVISIIGFLIFKGWFIGFFGLLMLLAYADDMFARR